MDLKLISKHINKLSRRLIKEIKNLKVIDIKLIDIKEVNNNIILEFDNEHTVIVNDAYPFVAPIIQSSSGYYQHMHWSPMITLIRQFNECADNDNYKLLVTNIKVMVIGRTLNQLINNNTKGDLPIKNISEVDIEQNLILSLTDIIINIDDNILKSNRLNTINITFYDPDNKDDLFIKSILKYINKTFIINNINVTVEFFLDEFRVNTVTDLDLVIIDWSTQKLLNNYDIGTTKYSFILELYLNLKMNALVYLFNTDYNTIFINDDLLDKSGNTKKDMRLKYIFEKLFESINTYCYIKNINNTKSILVIF